MMNRFICIHGHFYQPPRENPWLESVEKEDSAKPYHDWNERVTEECYVPNANARILNEKKQIVKIVNNYAKISFNFGPTLLSWISEKKKNLYHAILKADEESQRQFGGHGNALAQAYNHLILPLANYDDKLTQIIWGIRDFEHHFKRKPEGMWIPETAVNLETLTLMAEQGIKFTILAQHQAKQMRKIGTDQWNNTQQKIIDPTMPYLIKLPKGLSMVIFFYDGKVSQEVAFSNTLNRGENLAESIKKIFVEKSDQPQLAHIATDGETYGHHHAYGEMALAYALEYMEDKKFAKLINYGQFLEKFPPTNEVEIIENSSWSCIHGIERWKSSCGCTAGSRSNWNQNWRAPLRETLDWLRDKNSSLYKSKGMELFNDPVNARNDYIDIILDRSEDSLKTYFNKNTKKELNNQERIIALKLLEIQRNAMLMYTSCGWFFDELSGITTVQIIKYAARVAQLAQDFFSESIENELLERLGQCKSNIKQYQNGKIIYINFVSPLCIKWENIVAHYSISALFENYEKMTKIYCYNIETKDFNFNKNGNASLDIGYGIFSSIITTEKIIYSFASIHFGDQNISCGVNKFTSEEEYKNIVKNLNETFNISDLVSVSHLINKFFENSSYSINSLFNDEKRKILEWIISDRLKELEMVFYQLYINHITLIDFISTLNIPLPDAFKKVTEQVIKSELSKALIKKNLYPKKIQKLIHTAEKYKIKLDHINLRFVIKKSLSDPMIKLKKQPQNQKCLEKLIQKLEIFKNLPFSINLYPLQNLYFELMHNIYQKIKSEADSGDAEKKLLLEKFIHLGNLLMIEIPKNE